VGIFALASPAAAFAHAYLVQTDPASDAVLKSSPARVTLVFDEGIATTGGALGVYDSTGARVDSGAVLRPGGDSVAVGIPRPLASGTYTVGWRVTSADTHVVHGAFTFSVGAPGEAGGIAAKLLARDRTPASVSIPFTGLRFLNFLLVLVCGGGALALVLVLGDAPGRVRRRLAGVLVACAGALVILAAAGLPFEAAEAKGSGLGGGISAAAISEVRHLRFGEVWLARAWIALALALVALSLEHRPRRRGFSEVVLVGLGLALLVTPSAASHAGVSGPLTFGADFVHLAAAAAWTGGLAFLALALVMTSAGYRWRLATHAVPRFSTLAVGAVALLVLAGVTNAYLEVRAWGGLWQSTYGQLVLAKSALVLPLLALGAFNNRVSVPRLRAGIASQIERTRFLRAVSAELVLLTVIVGVTAVLVNEAPAKDRVAQTRETTATTEIGPFDGTVSVAPGSAGPNTIDLSFTDPAGRPARLAEVGVAASLPSKQIGPLRFTARRTSPGHYTVAAAAFPIAGSWRLQLTVRQGEFDEWTSTISIHIRKGISK